ncbi:MAG: hypothetical protein M1822_000695 [Bathelium mastoideum]|nr:MAG: hypothetical protein M1822_000695 [Bathelium mastoideum]
MARIKEISAPEENPPPMHQGNPPSATRDPNEKIQSFKGRRENRTNTRPTGAYVAGVFANVAREEAAKDEISQGQSSGEPVIKAEPNTADKTGFRQNASSDPLGLTSTRKEPSKKIQRLRARKTSSVLTAWKKNNMREVFPGALWPYETLDGSDGATIDSPETEIKPVEELSNNVLIFTSDLASRVEWALARELIEANMLERQNGQTKEARGFGACRYRDRGVTADDVKQALELVKSQYAEEESLERTDRNNGDDEEEAPMHKSKKIKFEPSSKEFDSAKIIDLAPYEDIPTAPFHKKGLLTFNSPLPSSLTNRAASTATYGTAAPKIIDETMNDPASSSRTSHSISNPPKVDYKMKNSPAASSTTTIGLGAIISVVFQHDGKSLGATETSTNVDPRKIKFDGTVKLQGLSMSQPLDSSTRKELVRAAKNYWNASNARDDMSTRLGQTQKIKTSLEEMGQQSDSMVALLLESEEEFESAVAQEDLALGILEDLLQRIQNVPTVDSEEDTTSDIEPAF